MLHVEMAKTCRKSVECIGNTRQLGPTHFQFACLIFCNSAAICRPSHFFYMFFSFLHFFFRNSMDNIERPPAFFYRKMNEIR